MKHFRFSIIFTIICLAISAYWGFTHGPEACFIAMFKVLAITSILAVMEVSLSGGVLKSTLTLNEAIIDVKEG